MIFALWLVMLSPKELPYSAVDVTAPTVISVYEIDPEEMEAESTGGR